MFLLWLLILCLHSTSAVIYRLNDSEHQRMPPLYSLDKYSSCLAEEGSSYCVLQLQLHAPPGNQLMHMIQEYSEHTTKHYNYSNIERGVCVSKTCRKYVNGGETEQELAGVLETCVSESLQREFGVSARVAAILYCERGGSQREAARVDAWDWTVLAAILAILALNLAGTLYHRAISKHGEHSVKNGNSFLLCFSVTRNWKKLINTEIADSRLRDLDFLNGFRLLKNVLTIYMHSIMSYTIGFSENVRDIEHAFEKQWYMIFLHGPMMVQLFFFMSGFLAVYHLRIQEARRAFIIWDIPKIVAQRLSRLVPGLVVTLAIATSWVRHAGSGPLWNLYVSGSLVADCRSYWWRHLLLYNNYFDDSKSCLVPTWQLAAEFQVFVVCVAVYVASGGRRAPLAALLLLGAAIPALHTLLQDLDAVFVTPQSFRMLDVGGPFWVQHAPGHTNLACFVMGMATAVWLYHWQTQGRHHVRSKWFTAGQYLGVPVFRLAMYPSAFFYGDGPRASLAARVLYSLAIRPMLGLVSVLFYTSLFVKNPSYAKSILEWKYWVIPSRLTFSVFLLHMILVNILMGARHQLSHFSFYNVGCTFLFITLVSYLVAVPLSLLVEAPCIMLFNNLSRKHRGSATNGTTPTSEAGCIMQSRNFSRKSAGSGSGSNNGSTQHEESTDRISNGTKKTS